MIKLYDYLIDEAWNEVTAVHLSHIDAKGAFYDVFSTADHITLPASTRKEAINSALSYRETHNCAANPVVVPYFDTESVETEEQEVKIRLTKKEWENENIYKIAHKRVMNKKLEDGWKIASVIRWGDMSETNLNGEMTTEEAPAEKEETRYFVTTRNSPEPPWREGYTSLKEAISEAEKRMSTSPILPGWVVIPKKGNSNQLGIVNIDYKIASLDITAKVLAYRPLGDDEIKYDGHIVVLSVVDSVEYLMRGIEE